MRLAQLLQFSRSFGRRVTFTVKGEHLRPNNDLLLKAGSAAFLYDRCSSRCMRTTETLLLRGSASRTAGMLRPNYRRRHVWWLKENTDRIIALRLYRRFAMDIPVLLSPMCSVSFPL